MTTAQSDMTTYLIYTNIKTSSGDEDIVFGDFTTDDQDILTKKTTHATASFTCPPEKKKFILFGDFSPEECSMIQTGTYPLPICSTPPQSPSHNNIYHDLPCSRCGYHSHTVEKCVARRNRYGELIQPFTPKKTNISLFPSSPVSPTTGPVYYNTHLMKKLLGDNTDYTQFKFTEEDINEWTEDCTDDDTNCVDYIYYRGDYMAVYKVYDYQRGQLGYNLRPAKNSNIEPDPEIEFALRLCYAYTHQMLYAY